MFLAGDISRAGNGRVCTLCRQRQPIGSEDRRIAHARFAGLRDYSGGRMQGTGIDPAYRNCDRYGLVRELGVYCPCGGSNPTISAPSASWIFAGSPPRAMASSMACLAAVRRIGHGVPSGRMTSSSILDKFFRTDIDPGPRVCFHHPGRPGLLICGHGRDSSRHVYTVSPDGVVPTGLKECGVDLTEPCVVDRHGRVRNVNDGTRTGCTDSSIVV